VDDFSAEESAAGGVFSGRHNAQLGGGAAGVIAGFG
jgi:hypothetical protein